MRTILAIMLLLPLTLAGCKGEFWEDIFQFRFTKAEREGSIEKLKKKAEEYEKDAREKGTTPGNLAGLYRRMGDRYLEMRSWNLAIDAFQKSIGYGGDSPLVQYALGVAYANRATEAVRDEDAKKAEAHYRRALEMQPDFEDAGYGLAMVLFYLKDEKKDGLDTMKKITAMNRKNYRARFAVGRFYYEMNEPSRALASYEELYSDLQKLPDSALVKEYRKNCRDNIDRLMLELAGKKG